MDKTVRPDNFFLFLAINKLRRYITIKYLNKVKKDQIWVQTCKPDRTDNVYDLINCQTKAKVSVELPSLMSWPAMPTKEYFCLRPSSTT